MADEERKTVKTVLKVETDFEKSTYTVSAEQGSSVPEMAFAVMVVVRTLIKNDLIKSCKDFTDMVEKYFNDPQYQEVIKDDKGDEKVGE